MKNITFFCKVIDLKLSILLYIYLNSSLFAEDIGLRFKSSARFFETQLMVEEKSSEIKNPPGWNLQSGFETNPNQDVSFMNRNTNSYFGLGAIFNKETTSLRMNLDLDALKRNKHHYTKDMLYFGKDCFIATDFLGFWVGVGRRKFSFRESPFTGSFDGGDGVFIERDFLHKWKVQMFLWDHYTGYRLLEKEMIPTYREIDDPFRSEGQRRRHSFGISYEDQHTLRLGISYLELGSFGKHTKEVESQVIKYGADGDALLSGNLTHKFIYRNFYSIAELLWAKGVDKTLNQSTTTKGSFVIEGEAISIGGGYNDGFLSFGTSIFLNDSDERNASNQIQKLGFVNSGTHIGSTFFLSQYLQIHPSAHVTEQGLERQNTILRGRSASSYGEIFFGIRVFEIQLKLLGALILPYKASGASDGKISVKKENYENFYIGEVALDLSYQLDHNQLGLHLSHLSSSHVIGLQGTMISCYGSVLF
jgi:hypothetical protein